MILALMLALGAGQTQAELSIQAGQAAGRADAAMNTAYRAAMAEMKRRDAVPAPDAGPGPTYAAALLAAQRAWLAFRDAECRVEAYRVRGGSARPVEAALCLAAVTRQRTEQLQAIARWPGR